MRLAAIDIGTNSLHMIVVRVRPDLSFEVIDREKEMVRLGCRGPGWSGADARGDAGRAPGDLEVQAPRRVARRGRDRRGGDERCPRSGKRRRVPQYNREPDRYPPARHLRHRRGPTDPHGRCLRRRRAGRSRGRSSTSAAAASRSPAARATTLKWAAVSR